MSEIIPFSTGNVPAHLAKLFGGVNKDLITAVSGYPSMSIKGKIFHVVRGQERSMVARPDGDPAASIEVVIVRANPNRSKVYYDKGYEEGSDAKPTCYSNDGVTPAADAEDVQAKKCSVCPHNQWGSRITDNGAKGKACSDSQRLAIAAPGLINDPMLLRVPAASLKACTEFAQSLEKRGVPYPAVVTKIGFDHTVAHPQLTFKPVGFVDEDTAKKIVEIQNSDLVKQIIGLSDVPAIAQEPETEEAPAPEPAPKAKPVEQEEEAPAPAPKAKATTAFAASSDEEEAPAPAPKAKAAKAAPVISEVSGDLASDISKVLGTLGFDDE